MYLRGIVLLDSVPRAPSAATTIEATLNATRNMETATDAISSDSQYSVTTGAAIVPSTDEYFAVLNKNVIFWDELTSIITNALCTLTIESFPIYGSMSFGFFLKSIGYLLYGSVLWMKKEILNRKTDIRCIYSVGNSVTLALIFSSAHHIFNKESFGVGSALFGCLSIFGALLSVFHGKNAITFMVIWENGRVSDYDSSSFCHIQIATDGNV